eukprot:TRINITY_DN29850_c0_g1_i1.p1 TRINITY_DN29850_c0_g1~~TRINITY_DN29850_c0_g1_i1.p1  ORF type:complete len:320 (+),score=61.74 TRINITY_DN29850_c0_g1_i1:67-1026(+)
MLRALLGLAVLLGAAADESYFEPQCASSVDYGWPRFENQTALEADTQWAAYFRQVYGELPDVYPVCVYDFSWLDQGAYKAAGLSGSRHVKTGAELQTLQEGDLFAAPNIGVVAELHIYHGAWAPLPDNAWVEVTHAVLPSEVGAAWVWRQRGTGLWVNTGTTKVFPTPSNVSQTHQAAIAYLTANCTYPVHPEWPQAESDVFGGCAQEKGIDTVQFAPQDGQHPMGTFGLYGSTEMALSRFLGDSTCGTDTPSATLYKAGWRASRHCVCVNEPVDPNCGLMPFAPMGITPHPPLCAAQARDPKVPCNALKCKLARCKLP